jgi:hypothetical protein
LAFIATNTNFGFGNYNAGTVSVHKRAAGLQFEASYTYTRNITNLYGCGTGANNFITEGGFGNLLCDPYNPGLDYGNTPFDRRHRMLATFLYDLPFGKGKALFNSSNKLVNEAIGGWTVAGVVLLQSGPFLTVTTLNDPSGVGYNIFGNGGGEPTLSKAWTRMRASLWTSGSIPTLSSIPLITSAGSETRRTARSRGRGRRPYRYRC